MATQADLVARVLKELYVLEGGATPNATDDATVDEGIAEVHAELQERRIALGQFQFFYLYPKQTIDP